MAKKLLMGNEAIALGAIRAGVQVVTGYPGTPSSEILETVAKHNDGSIYVEWSVNEKVALEIAAGASYAGARTMVTMKQMGLNVASDPLMSVNYVGVKGGMVVAAADDPGPISSQTEQDTRHYARFAKIALFDPSTPEEAYLMVADAFALSERHGAPVLFRPTTRVCHSCASVEILDDLPKNKITGFIKDNKWVIFPKSSYLSHIRLEDNLIKMKDELSVYDKNIFLKKGTDKRGVAAGGVSYAYALEAIGDLNAECALFKVSVYPFPEKKALEFLNGLDEVLVVEELDPVIEDELIHLCGTHNLNVRIKGKRTGHIQNAGENTVVCVTSAIASFINVADKKPAVNIIKDTAAHTPPALPARPPVLCAGCPHRASFYAVKTAMKNKKAVFCGDIGCYTLGNAPPLDMVDTCLCMGAGVTVAQGLKRAEPDAVHFAFIGDSTFFHSGITGVVNAVYNQTDIVVVILDNHTTAMTGNQPHPGMGLTMMGTKPEKVSIEKILSAIGVSKLTTVNPFDLNAAVAAVKEAAGAAGVRAVIFDAPCVIISKNKHRAFADVNKCNGCGTCARRFGCTAIKMENGKAVIDGSLCAGCGVCAAVCTSGAIYLKGGDGE